MDEPKISGGVRHSAEIAIRQLEAHENGLTLDATTQKVEAAVTHTAQGWTVTGYLRKFFGGSVEAGGSVTKRW